MTTIRFQSKLDIANNAPSGRPTLGHRGDSPVLARRQRGYSLIEIMIVVAIITILVAAAFFGWSAVQRQATEQQTKAYLGTARAILNEYAAATKLSSSATTWQWNGAMVAPATVTAEGLNLMTAQARYETNPPGTTDSSDAPDFTQAPDNVGDTWQLRNTARVMQQIRRLPASAKLVSGLPKDATTVALPAPLDVPLLVDGFGNPMLYIPTGLGNITAGGPGFVTVGGVKKVVKSPDGKPFWVSAGADGNFTTGDDNLYSFEN